MSVCGLDAERLAAQVAALDDSCHDYEGLGCERDEHGRCFSINRDDVLDLIRAAAHPAIEAEARSRALAEVRARVEGLPEAHAWGECVRLSRVSDVLAAIDEVSR